MIEQKALALVNEVRAERGQEIWKEVGDRIGYGTVLEALCRAIEQHESFKQEVSDEIQSLGPVVRDYLGHFIIRKPKPDPLVEVLDAMKDGRAGPSTESYAACLRAALEDRGLEIKEISK